MTTTPYAPAPLQEEPPTAPPQEPRGPIVRIARWSARHKWTAVLIWVAVVAATVVGGSAVGLKEATDSDSAVGESAAAVKALDRSEWADDVPREVILIEAAEGGTVDAESAAVQQLHDEVAASAAVATVSDPAASEDGSAVLMEAELAVPDGADEETPEAEAAAGDLAAIVDDAAAANPDLVIGHAGGASLNEAISQIYDDDLQRAEMISLPVTLLILVLAFGALIAAAVPVLLAMSAVIGAMGLSMLASHLVPSSDVVSSIILLIGLAVGVDYSLFYIRREREERLKGRSTYDAISIAAATSGRAVVVSGLTVMVAMAGMLVVGEVTFASVGVASILVVAMAMIGSVTVLPALLAIFGRWIDRPRVPLIWRLQSRDGNPRFWKAVLRPVLARPAIAFTLGAGVLVALAAPTLGMRLGDAGIDDLPQNQPAIQTYARMIDAFPAEGEAHEVVIWSEDGAPLDTAAVDAATAELNSQVSDRTDFAVSDPLTADYSVAGDVAEVEVPMPYDYSSDEARASLDELRDDLVPSTLGAVAGADVGVTGATAWTADFKELLRERMPLVIGFVLALTIIVLVLAFRSLTIALTAVVLNLLSVGAAYGLVTLVFQGTWAEDLLGFHSSGAILTWLPLFLFVILFGLSMDYHVFVVSRIREARQAGLSTREAVAQGITRSAGTVTSAAIVMVAVFSIFATLSALDFKQMGVGLAAAILIDATLVRAVLLPSAMALLGERNWYLPRWMQKLPALH